MLKRRLSLRGFQQFNVSTGKYSVTCRSQSVSAAEGDDVTLQCRLHPPVNLSAYTLDWSRVDLKEPREVHVYRSKGDDPTAQMDRYRDRTTLNHEELSRGIVTLLISSVQLSDSGLYKCYIPKLKSLCISFETVEEDQQSTTGPPEEDVAEPNNASKYIHFILSEIFWCENVLH
uniref:Ig-like domain-containing protein n=1 Tax=Dicentrarchus labrax TaxID=13489 RepID=A0A8P4FY45_DICLA